MSTASQIWSILSTAQRRSALGLFALMLAGTVFEMLGIGVLLPALTMMAGGDLGFMDSPSAKQWLRFLGDPGREQLVFLGIFALLGVYVLKAVVVLITAWRQARFVRQLEKDLCHRLFTAYMAQPWEFHLQRNSAELIRNITNMGGIADATASVLNTTAELLVLSGLALMLFWIDPFATTVVGVMAAVSTWSLDRLTKQRSVHWGKIRHDSQGQMTKAVQQGLGGAKDAKMLGCERQFLDSYEIHAAATAAMMERQTFIGVVPRIWNESLGVSVLCLLTLVFAWQGKDMAAFLPALGVYAAAGFRMLPSVNRLSIALQMLRYFAAPINTVVAELALESPLPTTPTAAPLSFGKEIALEKVSYRYEGSDKDAIDGVDIRIPHGSSVGIVGTSGAGKSTLVDVILGLLPPASGSVNVDEVDISENLRGWQNMVGYVPQVIYLCDDTIRANIAFGVPPERIDEAALQRALRAAQLEAFVNQLPDGDRTLVGERGVRLSGGQRQRIGIARALYHDPPVLVLDEATSALDTLTERGVMEAVEALHGAKTLVIIAHRLSTVANCDLLYRLENGRIEQSGSYAEIANC
jgi:ABC-type multidrug transport system fused ATPase/permease subunit